MAAVITTVSSLIPKTGINGSIATSAFTNNATGTEIKEITLTEIQEAVTALNTYVTKVKGFKNVYNYTIKSTSCQSIKTTTTCQSTTCQVQTCQSSTCQSYSCQSCQQCQRNCQHCSTCS